MPTLTSRADKFCSEPGCGKLTKHKYCDEHGSWNAELRARPWKRLYGLASWRRLRLFILERDPICALGKRRASVHADHIVDHEGDLRLFYDPANLQGLCESCHNTKTALTLAGRDWREGKYECY